MQFLLSSQYVVPEEDYEVLSSREVVGDITHTSLCVHNFCYFSSDTLKKNTL